MQHSSSDIFMLVVEEMSFTKAAKRAFLTQQCVSDHIRRLEAAYGTRLFERRPRLALTAAGEIMHSSTLQMQNTRKGMEAKLREVSRGAMGELTVGMNSSRAKVLMPRLFSRYHTLYPDVSVSIFSDDTPTMAQMLIKGKLDLFLAVDAASNPLFKVKSLTEDRVYLVVSDGLLERCLGPAAKVRKELERGVDLARFEDVPFVRNFSTSTINSLIDKHVNRFNLDLRTIFHVSDYDTQLRLCATDQVAAFMPCLILENTIRFNETSGEGSRLNIFPIEDMTDKLRVDCVYLKNAYLPQYAVDFMALMAKEIEDVKRWLSERGID